MGEKRRKDMLRLLNGGAGSSTTPTGPGSAGTSADGTPSHAPPTTFSGWLSVRTGKGNAELDTITALVRGTPMLPWDRQVTTSEVVRLFREHLASASDPVQADTLAVTLQRVFQSYAQEVNVATPLTFSAWLLDRKGKIDPMIDNIADVVAKSPTLDWDGAKTNGQVVQVARELPETPPDDWLNALAHLWLVYSSSPTALPPPVVCEGFPAKREVKTFHAGRLVNEHVELGIVWTCKACGIRLEKWGDAPFKAMGEGKTLDGVCKKCGAYIKIQAAQEKRIMLANDAVASQVIAAHRMAQFAKGPKVS